jgi:hypothetical protein
METCSCQVKSGSGGKHRAPGSTVSRTCSYDLVRRNAARQENTPITMMLLSRSTCRMKRKTSAHQREVGSNQTVSASPVDTCHHTDHSQHLVGVDTSGELTTSHTGTC